MREKAVVTWVFTNVVLASMILIRGASKQASKKLSGEISSAKLRN